MRTIKFRAVLNEREYDVSTRTPLHRDANGWHKRQGYIVRLTANHPFADKRGYVLEHRLIMEEHLGRFLTDNEVIHHKDGNRTNNEISNLELMDDQKIHAQIEMKGKRNDNGRVVAQDPIFEEIKFRLFNKNTGLTEIRSLSKLIGTTYRRGQFEFRGRFTGLHDKNGVEIYEGDRIQYREPYRTTQTHTGNNIPNGSYTEPMEPGIRTHTGIVIYKEGMFQFQDDDNDTEFPLIFCITDWDLDSIETAISYNRPDRFIFNDPEEGDLQYLITECAKVETSEQLIEYLNGVEVIGNIYQHPNLIK